jgi:hypothetical protein
MSNLPVIQSLWIGQYLSEMELMCVNSFNKNDHCFHLYVYEEIKNIPKFVIVKDANEIIPADKIFKYKDLDSFAGFSNEFRYKLLIDKGNYWVDMDTICLKPFNFQSDYLFCSAYTDINLVFKKFQACSGIIKAPINDRVMNYCYSVATSKNRLKLEFGETGPDLIRLAIKKFELQMFIVTPEIFCPINWWEWKKLTQPNISLKKFKNSYAIHLWNEMWRRDNYDKSGVYPDSSIYEQLKNKFL